MRKSWDGEAYLTTIQVEVVGTSNKQRTKHVLDLLGRYDQQVMSVTRRSGYLATLTARLIRENLNTRTGDSPPYTDP